MKDKLTLQEILNIENELKLIENKVRLKLGKRGIATLIKKKFGIDYTQLSDFKVSKRKFSIKRIFQIAKFLSEK